MRTLSLLLIFAIAVDLSAQEFSGRVVRSMAELRALTPIPSRPYVRVLSYYGDGNGGGGDYVITNTVAGTNAHGGRVLAFGGTKSWQLLSDVVSAKQFGARSLVFQDNQPYLQSMLEYAKLQSIPMIAVDQGWYWVSNTWSNPGLIIIDGSGSRSAIDTLIDSSVSNAVVSGDVAGIQAGFAKFGATVLARMPGFTGPMIALDTTRAETNSFFPSNTLSDGTTVTRWHAGFTIRGIAFYGANNLDTSQEWFQPAISAPHSWDFEISDCAFVRIKGPPVWAINANGFRFERNAMLGSSVYGSLGLIHWHGSDSHIRGNYMFGGRGPGLWISQDGGWLNGDISGNYFGNFDGAGYKQTTNIVSSVMTTSGNHELFTGQMVTVYPVTLGDPLPSPLSADVTYYAIRVSDTTYQLSTNHTAGTALTISGAYSTPFYICPGPAAGIYLNDGAKGNVILGGRCDQNFDQGIRFAGAARNAVFGTVVKQNGYQTSLGSQRAGTNVAGTTYTAAGSWGCTDNHAFGVITVSHQVAREFLNSAGDNAPVAPVDDSGSVQATDFFQGSLASFNYLEIGATNGTIAAELRGGSGAASILVLNRPYTQSVGLTVTQTGVSAGSANGAVLVIRDQTNNLDILGLDSSSTIPKVTVGSRNAQASPRAGQLQGAENASGTDIAGGNLTIDPGRGTGAASGANISLRVPVPGSTGTTLQSLRDALRIQAGTADRDTDLLVFDRDSGTLRRAGTTNVTVGTHTARFLYLK